MAGDGAVACIRHAITRDTDGGDGAGRVGRGGCVDGEQRIVWEREGGVGGRMQLWRRDGGWSDGSVRGARIFAGVEGIFRD